MHHVRNEDVGNRAGLGAGEALGRDAHDLETLAALTNAPIRTHANPGPDDVGIARKAAGPVIVGENRDGTRAGLQVVGFCEEPAQSGTESEGTEHPSGNKLSRSEEHTSELQSL